METTHTEQTVVQEPKLSFLEFSEKWVIGEAKRHAEHTRSNPPLLPGDKLQIGNDSWEVKVINVGMLATEWPVDERPKLELGLSSNPARDIYLQERPIAVVYPEGDKRQTHYLFFGREGKRPRFQLVPVDEETRNLLDEQPEVPNLKSFLRRDGDAWIKDLPLRDVSEIKVSEKKHLPEGSIFAVGAIRSALKERVKAQKYAGNLGIPLFMGTTAGTLSGVIPPDIGYPAMWGVSAPVNFVLGMLGRDLRRIALKYIERPEVKRLAGLRFRK